MLVKVTHPGVVDHLPKVGMPAGRRTAPGPATGIELYFFIRGRWTLAVQVNNVNNFSAGNGGLPLRPAWRIVIAAVKPPDAMALCAP